MDSRSRFRQVIFWDSIVPLVLALTPFPVKAAFPRSDLAQFGTALLLPIAAALICTPIAWKQLLWISNGSAPWLRQLAVAAAVIVLMLFEMMTAALIFANDEPLSIWVWPLGFYLAYLLLIVLALRPHPSFELPEVTARFDSPSADHSTVPVERQQLAPRSLEKSTNVNRQADHQLLRSAYAAFNARDIDAALAAMHADVAWPNGMEGGYVHGHDAVREYWTRQWGLIDPHVEPLRFELDVAGRIVVDVHQMVRDHAGTVLVDQMVQHAYLVEDGLIQTMEIRTTLHTARKRARRPITQRRRCHLPSRRLSVRRMARTTFCSSRAATRSITPAKRPG